MENKTGTSSEASAKTSRYLKYAIGEIILVVIGILIALQINNWNEARKLEVKESIYLSGLKTDFQQSQKSLERVINKTNRVALALNTLIDLMKTNGEIVSSNRIDSLSSLSTGFTVFMPSEGVINDIIGSGKLDMIKNKGLRSKIASWEADLRMIRENEKLSRENSIKYTDYMSKYFDLVNRKYGKTQFINEKRTEYLNDYVLTNFMSDMYGSSKLLNEDYQNKALELDSLITLIDKELE